MTPRQAVPGGTNPSDTSAIAPATAQTASGSLNGRRITPAVASAATLQIATSAALISRNIPADGPLRCAGRYDHFVQDSRTSKSKSIGKPKLIGDSHGECAESTGSLLFCLRAHRDHGPRRGGRRA